MSTKRSDQIAYLEACRVFAETGKWTPFFCYPNCGQDLFDAGLLAKDGDLTRAGRAALFLLDKGPETEPDTSVVKFSIPLPDSRT